MLDPTHADVVTGLATDIAALGIWDSAAVASLGLEYLDFAAVFGDGLPDLDGKAVVFLTGSDGAFQVTLRRNRGLSADERALLHRAALGVRLSVTSTVMVGEPAYTGTDETLGLDLDCIEPVVLPHGEYLIDAHALVTRTGDGEPEHLQYVLCIHDRDRVSDRPSRPFSRALRLIYSELTDAELDRLEAEQAAAVEAVRESTRAVAAESRAGGCDRPARGRQAPILRAAWVADGRAACGIRSAFDGLSGSHVPR